MEGKKKQHRLWIFCQVRKRSELTKYRSSDHWRPGTVWYRHGHTGAALCFLGNQWPADQLQTCAGGGRCPHSLGRQPGGGRCDPGCHGCWGHTPSLGASWRKVGLHQCRPAAEARWSATSRWWRHRTCPSGYQKIPAYLKRGKPGLNIWAKGSGHSWLEKIQLGLFYRYMLYILYAL